MLWYGIGILYDRYGSYDYAEEAFSQVMQIQPDFDKANEIYFRLGIIYKQQNKFPQSLEVCLGHSRHSRTALTNFQCFKYIVNSPPTPLSQDDIWFQIGHVHEQQKDVSVLIVSPSAPTFANSDPSLTALRMLIIACWTTHQVMPRSFSNWAGFTTNKVMPMRFKSVPFSISRNRWGQVCDV